MEFLSQQLNDERWMSAQLAVRTDITMSSTRTLFCLGPRRKKEERTRCNAINKQGRNFALLLLLQAIFPSGVNKPEMANFCYAFVVCSKQQIFHRLSFQSLLLDINESSWSTNLFWRSFHRSDEEKKKKKTNHAWLRNFCHIISLIIIQLLCLGLEEVPLACEYVWKECVNFHCVFLWDLQ